MDAWSRALQDATAMEVVHHDEAAKVIAYRIWDEEGRPEGRALDHWLKAEALWYDEQQFEEHLAKDVEGCALCT